MLTGDNEATARRIADLLGIDTVIAEVMPGDKADKIAELQRAGKRVAMVGDGVKDGHGVVDWRSRRPRGWLGRHPLAAVFGVFVLVGVGVWGVNIVRLSRSVEVHREYWAETRGEPGGLLYVALGDSAAQGIGASRPERGYVGLLAGRMRQQTGRPVQVVNLSRSGATIRDLLNTQLPKLRELQPDVVTVAIGGNDVRSYQRARFSADADELTAALPPGTHLADVPDFMHGRWGDRAVDAGGILTASAGAHQLLIVRLHDTQRNRGASAMLTDFAADWFHPNDRGHRVWADAFWNSLRHSPALTAEPTGQTPRR